MTATVATCLACGAPITTTVVDLGLQPLANSYGKPGSAAAERKYPLHARLCQACLLVQVDRVVPAEELFSDYAYFSSYSDSWLAHCRDYAAKMIRRFRLDTATKVVEIASNDGYLLQYFRQAGVPVLGVDPAANVAAVARERGVPTEVAFFGAETARRLAARGDAADLLAAKNVLAHVPDINDFVAGLSILMKPEGVFSVEFPHLLNMIEQVQFDTIYHEHFTYLSLLAVERIFSRWGLRVFDVEEIPTHGGSLHVMACHDEARHVVTPNVGLIRDKERAAKLDRPEGYAGFGSRVRKVRTDLLAFLAEVKSAGKTVGGYGAAAKGNTLLNYCGIGTDSVAFVADRSPAKQNKLLPGSLIEIKPPESIFEARPDYVLILPWNIRTEIEVQLAGIRAWGGRFVTAIPELRIN
ncbi:MAG TPA: class I SAM-dependent methyltransferase [Xanthobacteraceae bacterium]|nr:class I SAM-dependent methyltransferase [Xanthobacteraceae bacterium]